MRDSCTARARTSGEALHGTASRARRWILFEHAGAWGRDVLTDRTLPPRVGTRLSYLSGSIPARVLLLRRPGRGSTHTRGARSSAGPTLFVGVTTPAGGWFERFDLEHAEALFDLDLDPLGQERSCGGTPVTEPFYLVCTNGKHDPCCAEFGRPVAAALASRFGERVWECSHVGGDRFAGNLVCLPSGTFYGHLDADTAVSVVDAHERGELDLGRWRGRSSLPFPVQSAEAFARRELALARDEALRYSGSRRDGDRTVARFTVRDGRGVTVTVRRRHAEVERQLTCAGTPVLPPVHDLLDLEVTAPGGRSGE